MKLKIFTPDATQSHEADFNFPTFEGTKGLQAVKEVVDFSDSQQGSAT